MLEEASARFRQWLTKIYRELSLLNVELNDGVQGMSDRMLATDTETEEASIQHGTVDLTTGGLDALGVSNPQQEVTRRGIQTARGIAAQRREYGRTGVWPVTAGRPPKKWMRFRLRRLKRLCARLLSTGTPLPQPQAGKPPGSLWPE